MRQLLVHSSGYPRPAAFLSDLDELNCGYAGPGGNRACKWSPSSLDFAAMGENSGGSKGVNSVVGLRILLENQPRASIKELRLVGHGNESLFSFAGTILTDNVAFTEAACIGDSATFNSELKSFQRLADRFAHDGSITVMGCNTGRSDGNLLNFLSKAFLVPVKGFVELIDYRNTSPDIDTSNTYQPHARFQQRGQFRYASMGQLFDSNWETNAWHARPDASSQITSLASLKANRARQASGNQVIHAANLLWDMVHQYFHTESHLIDGTGFYPASELSLATVVEGSKKTIEVSQGYIDNLSTGTLHWRLRELRIALDLLQQGVTRPIALQR